MQTRRAAGAIRETTYSAQYMYLHTRVIPELGHVMLRKLTVEMFQKLYQKWAKEPLAPNKKPLSPNTIRLLHGIIRQALEDAVKWKKLAYNPAQHAMLLKAREAEIPEQARVVHSWHEKRGKNLVYH